MKRGVKINNIRAVHKFSKPCRSKFTECGFASYSGVTGGHFACACVNPLNDNRVGASNLMAGNRKLARKVTVLLKAISLVL